MKTSSYALINICCVLMILFAVGCTKETTRYSTITIYNPTLNQTFCAGDTVHVNALITADIELHGYSVIIKNLTSGQQVHTIDQHSHGGTIPIGTFWINTVSEDSDMRVYINAHIDDDSKHETDSLDFICHS